MRARAARRHNASFDRDAARATVVYFSPPQRANYSVSLRFSSALRLACNVLPYNWNPIMNTTVWLVGGAVLVLAVYLLVMRVFFRRSKALDKQIDFDKIKKIEDDNV